jgi:putative transposase
LSPAEDQALLGHLHCKRFQDAAPRQVYATLLSEGELIASVSTMYRRLRVRNECRERRNQRPAQHHVKPQLEATAPNQIMTWDITKLPTLTRGLYLNLYVILDLFSRYAVGWMISRKENAGLARHMFSEVLTRRQITTEGLVVHQDRGSPMIAHSFADLMSSLKIKQSFSRPRVSNDNAFSESQFKTTKYWPSYPGRFRDEEHARECCNTFLRQDPSKEKRHQDTVSAQQSDQANNAKNRETHDNDGRGTARILRFIKVASNVLRLGRQAIRGILAVVGVN